MSWIEKLYKTYEQCAGTATAGNPDSAVLAPPYHIFQQAHIEVSIDGDGNYRRATVVEKEYTLIPSTEQSATAKTSKVVPHPLCDHIKYCAGDFKNGGDASNKYFVAYRKQLSEWCASAHSHPKAIAVLKYIEKQTLLRDLIREGIVPLDSDGRLLATWQSKEAKPPLLKQLTADKGKFKPQNALIRWRVEMAQDPVPEVWKEMELQDAWMKYCTAAEATKAIGCCMVTGENRVLATKHPNRIRNGKDGAKLISNKKESESDFVYLGRFLHVEEACGVGLDVSQKAHSALQWLIRRQGFPNGDQVIVAWAVSGKPIPDPMANSAEWFGLEPVQEGTAFVSQSDAGQSFANRLNRYLAGFRSTLGSTDEIVVMGLDSATTGRMAITYYRELTGSELLERVESWHAAGAWPQNYSTKLRFVGVPSPKDIAWAAYGSRQLEGKSGEKLRKATVERLLPCIIDGRFIPRDLVDSAVRRATSRSGHDKTEFDAQLKAMVNEWEKTLGIACSLFRGYHKERNYKMTLETTKTDRDYLYGRLLAVAEHIEGRALHVAGEKRETTAAKLMQRFADRPYSTWRTIELALPPSKARLRAKRPGFLVEMERLMDEIVCAFQGNDFTDPRKLTGEFLLSYHCQRLALRPKNESEPDAETTETETNHGE